MRIILEGLAAVGISAAAVAQPAPPALPAGPMATPVAPTLDAAPTAPAASEQPAPPALAERDGSLWNGDCKVTTAEIAEHKRSRPHLPIQVSWGELAATRLVYIVISRTRSSCSGQCGRLKPMKHVFYATATILLATAAFAQTSSTSPSGTSSSGMSSSASMGRGAAGGAPMASGSMSGG